MKCPKCGSKIYTMAAERIANGYAGNAGFAIMSVSTKLRKGPNDFFKMFHPNTFGHNQLARSLALLFMAEIAKEEEK
jgi:hypothetical protein